MKDISLNHHIVELYNISSPKNTVPTQKDRNNGEFDKNFKDKIAERSQETRAGDWNQTVQSISKRSEIYICVKYNGMAQSLTFFRLWRGGYHFLGIFCN